MIDREAMGKKCKNCGAFGCQHGSCMRILYGNWIRKGYDHSLYRCPGFEAE